MSPPKSEEPFFLLGLLKLQSHFKLAPLQGYFFKSDQTTSLLKILKCFLLCLESDLNSFPRLLGAMGPGPCLPFQLHIAPFCLDLVPPYQVSFTTINLPSFFPAQGFHTLFPHLESFFFNLCPTFRFHLKYHCSSKIGIITFFYSTPFSHHCISHNL